MIKRKLPKGTMQRTCIDYFKKHPDVPPMDVRRMFGAGPGGVCTYRKMAREELAAEAAVRKNLSEWVDDVFYSQKTINDALAVEQEKTVDAPPALPAPPAPTNQYRWQSYGQYFTSEEFAGYLRGRIFDAVSEFDGNTGGLAEARACIDKLHALKKG